MDQQLLDLLISIGSVSLVPLAGGLVTIIINKIKLQSIQVKGDVWEKAKMVVKVSVLATEQKYQSGQLGGGGRKKSALENSKRMLESKKIKIDDDILSEMIEAEIWGSLNSPQAQVISTVISPAIIPAPVDVPKDVIQLSVVETPEPKSPAEIDSPAG